MLLSIEGQKRTAGRWAEFDAGKAWRALCLALCVFCLIVAAPTARAQETAAPATENNATTESTAIPKAPVQVAGRVLFEIIGTDASDALRRADKVNRRLERLIKREEDVERFAPEDVENIGNEIAIVLGGEEVVTVTQADAQHYLTPAPELAQEWGRQLSRAVRTERLARSGTVSNILILMVTAMFDLVRSVTAWLPRLLGAFVLALLFWMLARFVRWLTLKATLSRRLDPNLRQLSLAIAFYGVWALGVLAMLSALGIDSASIAATVGVSGFVLGFAFKDVLSHFLAGMMLLVGRQFSIGGDIVVGEYEGTVESIDLRALHLRTYDNRLVTIPNGDVFNSAVIANTHNRYRRREFTIGIGFENDARRAIELALQTIQGVQGVLIEPPPQVVASGLTATGINLRVLFFVSTSNTDSLAVQSECILRVKEKFADEGISVNFNTHIIDLRHAGEIGEVLQKVQAGLPAIEGAHNERAPEKAVS